MKSLVERDSRVIWHPFTQVGLADAPIPLVGAHGARLILEDGSELVDGIS